MTSTEPGGTAGGHALERIEEAITRAGAIAGGGAALVVLVHLVGGVVMWLRFRKANLPADQAVALMSRGDLLVIGLRLMVIPLVVTGSLAAGLVIMRRRRTAAARTVWSWLTVWVAVVFVVALALVVPLSAASLTWPVAFAVVFAYWRHRTRGRERASSTWRLVAVVVVSAAVISLGRQLDEPVQLLSATVSLDKPTRTLKGVYVSVDGDAVYLGDPQRHAIRAVRRTDVASIVLGPPSERAPNPSLLSVLAGGPRFSLTPLEWWCDGERYSWGELGDLCRTQPSLFMTARRVDRGYASVRVRCPERAKDGCRGYLRLTTIDRYMPSPLAAFRHIPLGPKQMEVPAGRARELCIRAPAKVRYLFSRKAPEGAEQPRDPVPFEATISQDVNGVNVLTRTAYSLSVPPPGTPPPPTNYSDCP